MLQTLLKLVGKSNLLSSFNSFSQGLSGISPSADWPKMDSFCFCIFFVMVDDICSRGSRVSPILPLFSLFFWVYMILSSCDLCNNSRPIVNKEFRCLFASSAVYSFAAISSSFNFQPIFPPWTLLLFCLSLSSHDLFVYLFFLSILLSCRHCNPV